jgi:hypothetical protein
MSDDTWPVAPHVVLLDSVSEVSDRHAGLVVVTGSHGGASAARYAAAVPARLYVFNDAGVGKDGAGIAALALLGAQGIAAVAVAHSSARIGDAHDTWTAGIISAVNAAASRLGGLRRGALLSAALRGLSVPPR